MSLADIQDRTPAHHRLCGGGGLSLYPRFKLGCIQRRLDLSGRGLFVGLPSVIANMMAGYTMIYRRAFKVGDRISIDNVTGDVTERRLMVTHLHAVKNEEVIVPNSTIINSNIINYSTLARSHGLILHTTVGIGYETPWRQVEAMLLLASDRTPGLLKEPAPFVLQKSLGDFAVNYELNAYCAKPHAMTQLYTAMHRNILDIFNEHGVQIMTPPTRAIRKRPRWFPRISGTCRRLNRPMRRQAMGANRETRYKSIPRVLLARWNASDARNANYQTGTNRREHERVGQINRIAPKYHSACSLLPA